MESYLVASESISFLHKKKIAAVLLKVDFAKAFDSVSWCFLTNLLIERGFPPLWISWVLNILRSSTSAVLVNGKEYQTFRHYRGFRQGDPLSPMLFILVADALQRFVTNATHLMAPPILLPPHTLQFADDTAIILEAHPLNLRIVMRILRVFADLTGLSINSNKSCFVPIAMKQEHIPIVQSILDCQAKGSQISYLGLPLLIKKLKKVHFQPLLAAIQRRLQGWKSKFLSFAGRLTLVKSVLTAMPLHYMQVIRLPKWVINQIDKMRRNFLWKGNDKCLGGHCLVNWDKCCMPKQHGGLGILNLKTQNEALLAKWIWVLLTKPDSVWSTTISDLFGTTDLNLLHNHSTTSTLLSDLLKSRALFPLTATPDGLHTTTSWRWTATRQFTVASAYRVMAWSGVISPYHKQLWKLKALPKVILFLWLMLMDKILTQQNLMKRGWPAIQACKLCHLQAVETSNHLFVSCPFAKVTTKLNVILHASSTDALSVWQTTAEDLPIHLRTFWSTLWAATCWTIWKRRCALIFKNQRTSLRQVMLDIESNTRLWLLN
ncbi:RNA-directed DNA polymerase (reverse transcriptase)-related family protein [Rhynchospora pubera]|uniref:RNA-directed DNA polymerase (Reverse transcriptase)-related family protein n=1 Tax=Rhynchospora pubera TaxID=906938 RepID=A0AAV8CGG0_9POAL|nr:RNA-directed DNA polymerase (reverse transcriptase)-related family protein [Rhynchospora pubera]